VIARIAFDADGDRIAIAYSDGRIEIKGGFPILGLHGDDSGENLPTSALMFSPNGRYLARIQGPDVSLWRLGFLCGRLRLVEDAGGGHLLAFTGQTGLLLVGGADQVRVWSAETGALVGRIETQGITSLTVSTDDRLIVWGDTEGGIHVLAATH
jgi:WD40 repeat protein